MKDKNEQFIITYCAKQGEPLTTKDLIDWNIDGTETKSTMKMMANDYLSECHTAKCEDAQSWRYLH